jgi:hypothetical protein
MSTVDMRSHVIAAYSGDAWRKKVLQMSDGQVLAIFRSLQKRNEARQYE